jgi:pimeloyl-ACP methyl ester carboxylesterase
MIPKPPRKLSFPYRRAGAQKQMVFHEWGDAGNPRVLVCVHGLSRNGRDFDVFAAALSAHYRVLCPDVPGRGESAWFDRATDYNIPVYVEIIQKILTEHEITHYDWVGTSMGGLIGMMLAALPGSGMQKFVINDVGPEIERAALERIGVYMGMRLPAFDSFDALLHAALPAIASFGPLTESQQRHLVRTSCAKDELGKWHFNNDPKIGQAFVTTLAAPPVDLWPLWRAVRQPTLILRGEHSDLLSPTTLARMLSEKKNAQAKTIANTGHAPMLMDAETIELVRAFLG